MHFRAASGVKIFEQLKNFFRRGWAFGQIVRISELKDFINNCGLIGFVQALKYAVIVKKRTNMVLPLYGIIPPIVESVDGR
jgi:hypothetical protein